MHEEDLLLPDPFSCQRRYILTHELEIRLAEGNSIYRTRYHVKHAAIIRCAGKNASDPTEWRERWIVGMQRHLHIRFLCNRNHSAQEIFEVAPNLPFAYLTPFGETLLLGYVIVEF